MFHIGKVASKNGGLFEKKRVPIKSLSQKKKPKKNPWDRAKTKNAAMAHRGKTIDKHFPKLSKSHLNSSTKSTTTNPSPNSNCSASNHDQVSHLSRAGASLSSSDTKSSPNSVPEIPECIVIDQDEPSKEASHKSQSEVQSNGIEPSATVNPQPGSLDHTQASSSKDYLKPSSPTKCIPLTKNRDTSNEEFNEQNVNGMNEQASSDVSLSNNQELHKASVINTNDPSEPGGGVAMNPTGGMNGSVSSIAVNSSSSPVVNKVPKHRSSLHRASQDGSMRTDSVPQPATSTLGKCSSVNNMSSDSKNSSTKNLQAASLEETNSSLNEESPCHSPTTGFASNSNTSKFPIASKSINHPEPNTTTDDSFPKNGIEGKEGTNTKCSNSNVNPTIDSTTDTSSTSRACPTPKCPANDSSKHNPPYAPKESTPNLSTTHERNKLVSQNDHTPTNHTCISKPSGSSSEQMSNRTESSSSNSKIVTEKRSPNSKPAGSATSAIDSSGVVPMEVDAYPAVTESNHTNTQKEGNSLCNESPPKNSNESHQSKSKVNTIKSNKNKKDQDDDLIMDYIEDQETQDAENKRLEEEGAQVLQSNLTQTKVSSFVKASEIPKASTNPNINNVVNNTQDAPQDSPQDNQSSGKETSKEPPKNNFKYYDNRVKKEVVFVVSIAFDKTPNGSYIIKSHWAQFKKLVQEVQAKGGVLIPVNENLEVKAELKEFNPSCESIGHESIKEYAPTKCPWIFNQKRGETRFAIKVRMPNKFNLKIFSSKVQEDWRAATKVDNCINFARVSEFDQIRVATILGCSEVTHIGDLKSDIANAYRDKYGQNSYIPMSLRWGGIDCFMQNQTMEAPVIDITVGRSIADKAIELLRQASEDADKRMELDEDDGTTFGRNISILLDFNPDVRQCMAPLIESQLKQYMRARAVKFKGIENLNQKVTTLKGKEVTLREAILSISSDNTADGVQVFYQVDRMSSEGPSFSKSNSIVLTFDEQLLEIAHAKANDLKEELKLVITSESHEKVFPLPAQKILMSKLYKDNVKQMEELNMAGALKRMEKFHSRRVSSALVVANSNTSPPSQPKALPKQDLRSIRKQMRAKVWGQEPSSPEATSKSYASAVSNNGNEPVNTLVPSQTITSQTLNQPNSNSTDIVPNNQPNNNSTDIVSSKSIEFKDLLKSLMERSSEAKAIADSTRQNQEEDRAQLKEFKESQLDANLEMGKMLKNNMDQTSILSEQVSKTENNTNHLKEQMHQINTRMSQIVHQLSQNSTKSNNKISRSANTNSNNIGSETNDIEMSSSANNTDIETTTGCTNAVPPTNAGWDGEK